MQSNPHFFQYCPSRLSRVSRIVGDRLVVFDEEVRKSSRVMASEINWTQKASHMSCTLQSLFVWTLNAPASVFPILLVWTHLTIICQWVLRCDWGSLWSLPAVLASPWLLELLLFGNKLLPFACKQEISYHATKSCNYLTIIHQCTDLICPLYAAWMWTHVTLVGTCLLPVNVTVQTECWVSM